MVEKFAAEDAKNGNFSNQMEFRKTSKEGIDIFIFFESCTVQFL